jgi:DNA-binding MarR family transcriptional regulator
MTDKRVVPISVADTWVNTDMTKLLWSTPVLLMMEQDEVTLGERMILLALAKLTGEYVGKQRVKGSAIASQAKLAMMTGMKPKSVAKILKTLFERGYIDRKQDGKSTCIYTIMVEYILPEELAG